VGDIAMKSRPYGFNTVIINLSCIAFGLEASEVAMRVPLPRRGVQARPAGATVLNASLVDGGDVSSPSKYSNPLGGELDAELERE
jgi:hypothetical protein